jgi:hypothetical protein
MTDFLVRSIPLPVSRPSGLDMEYQAFTSPTMPLGWPGKAADAFSGGGSYPTSGESVKPLYGLLIESSAFWWFWGILIVLGYTVYRFRRWRKLGI